MNNHSNHSSPLPQAWSNLPVMSTHGSGLPYLALVPPATNQEEAVDLEQQLRAAIQQQANQHNYTQAIALLTQLLEQNPQSATDYNNRGLMYFRNHQFAQALADYNQAIKLNPRLDSAYNNRANYYVQQQDFAAALADYETALDYNPGNLRALINQGITYREMELYDLALDNFDLALFLGKRLQGRIYAERGYTYHLRGDWNCAIADYYRALSLLSTKAHNWHYQQQVQQRLDQLLNPLSA